jgi:lipooligosaccharide transport system permease protein
MSETVNLRKALRYGAFFVAEARLRNMSKWLWSIIAVSFGNPIIYLLAIGVGVGTLVDQNTGGAGINGVSYLTFLAPALLGSAAIQAAIDETSFPTLEGFVWNKSFFGMNSTQLTGGQIVDGVMIAAFVRAFLTSVIYLFVLLVFGAVKVETIPILLLVSVIAGMSFGSAVLAASSFIKDDDGFLVIISRFIVAPLFLFSGTFYPLEQMPWFLQWVGWISPLWHSTNLSRALSFGLPVDSWLLVVHVLFIFSVMAIGLILARGQFSRRLAK